MNTTKIFIGQERVSDNPNIIFNLTLLSPREHLENLRTYVSAAFKGLVLQYAGEANHQDDHWKITVPDGTLHNAQIISQEITSHLMKLADNSGENLVLEYTPNRKP